MPNRLFLPPMAIFALASLTPMALLAVGAVQGGFWLAAALIWMTAFAATLDQAVQFVMPDATGDAGFPGADALLVAIGLGHLLLVPLAVWTIGGASGLSGAERVIAFFGFGLCFGQISNPAAHELIHRGNRWLYRFGVAVYVTLLFGHHASAHRLVHHRHAASDADPNSARRGEGFYRFLPRAWIGSFREGLVAENRMRAGRGGLHPYAVYLCGAALCLALAALIGGPGGLVVYILLAGHATSQLLLSDYVQHYGLRRRQSSDGRLEPVSDRHSWNAPHWFSSAMMLNAPRHSDHHAHPARPYPALRLPEGAPMLPYPLPMMAAIALMPRRWKRLMNRRLALLPEGGIATSRESEGSGAGATAGDLAV